MSSFFFEILFCVHIHCEHQQKFDCGSLRTTLRANYRIITIKKRNLAVLGFLLCLVPSLSSSIFIWNRSAMSHQLSCRIFWFETFSCTTYVCGKFCWMTGARFFFFSFFFFFAAQGLLLSSFVLLFLLCCWKSLYALECFRHPVCVVYVTKEYVKHSKTKCIGELVACFMHLEYV